MQYRVLTVGEIDRLVFERLTDEGAAKPSTDHPDRYVVTDREKARSSRIMPIVLNEFGQLGWRLVAVNKMECFIFAVDGEVPVEYRVLTPPDLDQMALSQLEDLGHARRLEGEGGAQNLEIPDPDQARIQKVLPRVLAKVGEDGWQLAAISGPQLYFFVRPGAPEA